MGYSPEVIYYGRTEYLTIRLYDPSGIYDGDGSDGAYMEWHFTGSEETSFTALSILNSWTDSALLISNKAFRADTLFTGFMFRVYARDNTPQRNLAVSDWQNVQFNAYTLSPASFLIDMGEACFGDSILLFQSARNLGPLTLTLDSFSVEEEGPIELVSISPSAFPAELETGDSIKFVIKYLAVAHLPSLLSAHLFATGLLFPVLTLNYTARCIVCRESPFSVAPNPFSPNGDGVNDLLHFILPWQGEHEVTIYNRYYYPVAHLRGRDGKVLWDGKSDSGENEPPGVYIYAIMVDGELEATGTVVLAR